MQLIGLAGPARVGKDSIADYLEEKYDYLRFSFSDALYDEVQQAFGLETQQILRSLLTKENPNVALALCECSDPKFVQIAIEALDAEHRRVGADLLLAPSLTPLSPRWVLQRWGTEYRRAQDPDYWVNRAQAFVETFLTRKRAGELPDVQGLVNTSVRFENELAFFRRLNGVVWHVYRREAEAQHLDTYVSERRLPVGPDDKELYNNGTIEQLGTAVSLLLTTSTQQIVLEKP